MLEKKMNVEKVIIRNIGRAFNNFCRYENEDIRVIIINKPYKQRVIIEKKKYSDV
jgi:hypothetical protein